MRFGSLDKLLTDGKAVLAKGPIALILAEDETELDSTLRHHLKLGFAKVVLFARPRVTIAADLDDRIVRVDHDTLSAKMLTDIVNGVVGAVPEGTWLFYCFNAEYLFFPFCEMRTVRDMLTFVTEERRDSVLTYVVDLYAGDLNTHPDAVAVDDAFMDRSGYYALARKDRDNHALDRQLDFFGGLRWRFEEHIPPARRRIDRIGLFRAKQGLKLLPDHRFNEAEYNTYACPWHNNITAAICSFRTAKALKRNPGSTFDIHNFRWHMSEQFRWDSQQLMDLGLMEPGQWF